MVALLFFILCTGFRLLDVWSGGPFCNDFMLSHFRFDSLFAGVLLQYLHRTYPARFIAFIKKGWYWLSISAVLLLLVPVLFSSRNQPMMFAGGFTGLIFAYSIVVSLAVSLDFSRIQHTILFRVLQSIGQWSYSIYLWHFFLPKLAEPLYLLPFRATAVMHLPRPALMTLQVLIYFICSIGAGWFFFKLIETPFMHLRRRIIRRSFTITPS